jgi:hypothetical protein
LGSDLTARFLEQSGNTSKSRFSLSIGQEYRAHAMALWTYGLGVLVLDDNGRPNWKPMELFTVSDGRLPANWEFVQTVGREPVVALWGYSTLVRDPKHHDDLIDRKLSALEVFRRETE